MDPSGTLPDALTASARRATGVVTFHGSGPRPRVMGAAGLLEEASTAARSLVGAGVRPADTVGVLGPNRSDWAVWAFATWIAGATLVPLPHPAMRDPAAMGRHAMRLARAAGCRLVLAEPTLAASIRDRRVVPWDRPPAPPARLAATVDPADAAVVQFTSGSTSDPKGVELSHGAILSAVEAHGLALETDLASYRELSWLPFFHDWGLFGGLVAPIVRGSAGDVLPTTTFVHDPLRWLRLATDVGATGLPAPPSVWPAVLDALQTDRGGIDLGAVRRCILAAELVPPDLVDRLRETGPEVGLSPDAVTTAYGMAEVVLGASTSPVHEWLRIDVLDPEALRRQGLAQPATGPTAKRVVSCGRPVPGLDLRVAGASGPLAERQVGEIEVRGGGLFSRYWGAGDGPRPDGWFATGDQGYLADGELFVTGRLTDVVIVHGQNFAPQDIEWAVGRVKGVRTGRVVAFPSEDEGEVTVVVEPARRAPPRELVDAVRQHTRREVGIVPRRVVVVARGSVQKTTSGKLRRAAVRDSLRATTVEVLAEG